MDDGKWKEMEKEEEIIACCTNPRCLCEMIIRKMHTHKQSSQNRQLDRLKNRQIRQDARARFIADFQLERSSIVSHAIIHFRLRATSIIIHLSFPLSLLLL